MFKRIYLYLNSMFPPISRTIYAFAHFFGLYIALQIAGGQTPPTITRASIAGAFTALLFMLFFRVTDELKDLEIDLRLFPDRALPSGGVNLSDLRFLLGVVVIALFAINMHFGKVLVPFLYVFGFGFLMFKFFFYPEIISKSLMLALITHNPVVPILNMYVFAVYAADNDIHSMNVTQVLLIVVFWLPMLVWELSRKIRAKEEETEYETYSQIFGYKLAATLPAAITVAHWALVMALNSTFHYSIPFLVASTLLTAYLVFGHVRFILNPNAKTSKLKPYAELYGMGIWLFLAAEMFYRGVQWNL